ncbi:helix-turn-helix domain-containing protein [Nocardia africana]|uniref:Helix-turn-helix domain n=1 Tax=Nocardia africana TaxID=134964 RepID=A0A378WSA8_9NOCA|nr:helix-turn-helix transcriptional regulator [Nocardia africana]MCC3313978.1 helix-turn-helix domain-containing protein [Nocardia africana]SUA43782.1 Helix-turn-helix domain [Nocardia africana]
MAEPGEPLSLPKRQLGYYLRQAREESGMSLAEAAAHIGRSAPTLMRIEKGLTQKLSVPEIEAYCRLYEFDEEKTDAMKGLAQQANTQNWWHEYDDLIPADFDIYVGLESAAQEIATYQPELIPGLLQTPDYARVLSRNALPNGTDDAIERHVQLKIRRQLLITRKVRPVELQLIVHEAALRRVVGSGKVMSIQVRYLADISTRENIDIRVLPFTAGVPVGEAIGPFVMLRFGHTNHNVVYAETYTGDLYLEKPASLRRYAGAYEVLRSAALDAARSRIALRQVAKEHLG